jgi:hypothetical protein
VLQSAIVQVQPFFLTAAEIAHFFIQVMQVQFTQYLFQVAFKFQALLLIQLRHQFGQAVMVMNPDPGTLHIPSPV